MNTYIESQIMNMTAIAKTFEQSCRMAAMKNDGRIDKSEEKILKKIEKATQQFIKDLESIK